MNTNEAGEAGAEWQNDHTELNVNVQNLESGEEKRPWITFVVDIHTRMVLGYQLSFTPPTDEPTKTDEDKDDN